MALRDQKKRRERRKMSDTYWLTAKAFGRTCSHCGESSSVALRPRDQNCACAKCVEEKGIKAEGQPTTVRYECPLCGGNHRRDQHHERLGRRPVGERARHTLR
jgi:hypothetical protein